MAKIPLMPKLMNKHPRSAKETIPDFGEKFASSFSVISDLYKIRFLASLDLLLEDDDFLQQVAEKVNARLHEEE